MRVNKWGVGVMIAAAVMLTGCSAGASDKPAAEKSTASTQQSAAPKSDCPQLKEGLTIDGAALGGCIAKAMAGTKGYAAKTSVMGIDSTGRFNPSEHAIETISPVGSLVIIGESAWVKSAAGDWQVADATSSDPIVAGLSSSVKQIASLDPATAAASITGTFTVTSTAERLGKKVYLVGGTVAQSDTSVDIVFEVTSDYINLASSSTASVNGQPLKISMEITEWDVAQNIVAPL